MDINQYRLNGILDSPIDERDIWYSDICKSSNESVSSITSKEINYQFDARDQKATGSCSFQAVTGTVEMVKSLDYQLSEGFLNAMRSSYGCYLDIGAITREIMGLACKCGFIPKSDFANLEDYPTIEASFKKLPNKDKLIEKAKLLKCNGYCRVSIEDVPSYIINENKPLVITTRLKNSFYDVNYPNTNGIVKYPPYGGSTYSHAMIITGFKYINGELYFKLLNSWSSYWCLNGYCWMNAKSPEINEIWGFTDERVINKPSEPIINKPIVKEYLYRLQLGAYSKYENCLNYTKELNSKGIATYIKLIDGLYKIQVGCFKVKDNAINYQKEIKLKGYDCFIVTEELN